MLVCILSFLECSLAPDNNMLLRRLSRTTTYGRDLLRTVLFKSIQTTYMKKNSTLVRKFFLTWMTSPFIAIGLWGYARNKNTVKEEETEKNKEQFARDALLLEADELFKHTKYKNVYDLLLSYKDSKDVEILWRLSRAIYKISKTASEVEEQRLINEGYNLLCTALDIKEDHYAVHKWIAIFLDRKDYFEGTTSYIKDLYKIKNHMMRALELNPSDATLLYMLGCWCYQISSLTWYQRKIVSLVYGQVPESSFEEALTYFETAEKIDPNFYNQNLLMIAKTYVKLNRPEDARKYLMIAAMYPANHDDDQTAKLEAQKMLRQMKKTKL